MNQKPVIADFYPAKALFHPGQTISFMLETEGTVETLHCRITLTHLHEPIHEYVVPLTDVNRIELCVQVDLSMEVGYGARVDLLDRDGIVLSSRQTAFDIARHWKQAPRYGFLSDFHPDEQGKLEDVNFLNKHHINVVQFYDWMYRHDQLVSEETVYTDPLGRTLSREVIAEKIEHLHEKGMHAIAYGAIYASLQDFYETHQDWALYQNDGVPYTLADLFYIMDISEDSPWNDVIIKEFEKVLTLGFDGIHMDQYGFPKKALRRKGGGQEVVDLAECFPAFINRTKRDLMKINEQVSLIFNNVSNYPTYATARTNQEAVYIEVWAPVTSFRDLKMLIDEAKRYAGDKHVILAAYLAPFNCRTDDFDQRKAENGALVTMAAIFASGAYHLLIGEDHNVLTEGYYPHYGSMSTHFRREMRHYYDFIVRYRELLFSHDFIDRSFTHTGGYNSEIGRDNEVEFRCGGVTFSPHGNVNTVWTIIKENDRYFVIHLVNLLNLNNDCWNEPKEQRPSPIDSITVNVLIEERISDVYWASPDHENGTPQQLKPHRTKGTNGYVTEVTVPRLNVWSMIYIVKQ